MIRIDVLGAPAPKGSGRAMLVRGKARFIAGGSKINAAKMETFATEIRNRVAIDVFDGSLPSVPPYVDRPLVVAIVFRLARPASHWGAGKHAGTLKPKFASALPTTKPDADKLCRHVLDVLTGLLWDDDARVVELLVRKEYAQPGNEGATILVDEWRPAS